MLNNIATNKIKNLPLQWHKVIKSFAWLEEMITILVEKQEQLKYFNDILENFYINNFFATASIGIGYGIKIIITDYTQIVRHRALSFI